MSTRALFRGPGHVAVDLCDEMRLRLGDFAGLPIREQFPELSDTGLFDTMDTVYITGEATEMPWRSLVTGEDGALLILPVRCPDGSVFGIGLAFESLERLAPRTVAAPPLVA